MSNPYSGLSGARRWLVACALVAIATCCGLPAAQAQTATSFLLSSADISAIGTAAASKLSPDLRREMVVTTSPQVPWWRWVGRGKLMRVVVLSNSTDPLLADLRSAVLAQGGSVFTRYLTVRGLSVLLPERGILALAQRADVTVISPNRLTTRSFSALEQSLGIYGSTAVQRVRTYDAITRTHAGLTGAGVGIAILDSGLMGTHLNFRDAAGASRARMALDFTRESDARLIGSVDWRTGLDFGEALGPGTEVRLRYENRLDNSGKVNADGYGHG
ncbi:MAG: hypothetical protein ACKO5J_03080, partial [Rubrivivax sp.]